MEKKKRVRSKIGNVFRRVYEKVDGEGALKPVLANMFSNMFKSVLHFLSVK